MLGPVIFCVGNTSVQRTLVASHCLNAHPLAVRSQRLAPGFVTFTSPHNPYYAILTSYSKDVISLLEDPMASWERKY